MAEERQTTIARAQAARPAAGQSGSKKKSKISGGALLSIVLIIAIAGFGAAVYFNLGGVKQSVAEALGMTTVEAAAEEKTSQEAAAQAKKDSQYAELKSRQESLSEKENELTVREVELSEREQQLAVRESAVAEAEGEAAQRAQDQADIKAAAEIFSKMKAAAAAKAIAGMDDVEDMVNILSAMPREQAALVMESMKDSLKTKILSEMMK